MKKGLELEINLFTRRVTNDIFSHIGQVTKWGFPSSVCFPYPIAKPQLRPKKFI